MALTYKNMSSVYPQKIGLLVELFQHLPHFVTYGCVWPKSPPVPKDFQMKNNQTTNEGQMRVFTEGVLLFLAFRVKIRLTTGSSL